MAFKRNFTRKKEDGSEDKRKIKSSKVTQDGITFDSRLENYMYNLLKENGIDFELKKTFELIPGFEYRHEKIHGMKCTPDFFIPQHNLILDTKGFSNELSPVRYKLLKYRFSQEGLNYRIEMPKNQAQCRDVIEQIKNGWVLSEQLTESAANKRKIALKKNGWIWDDRRWMKGGQSIEATKIMSLPHYEFKELLKNQLSLL